MTLTDQDDAPMPRLIRHRLTTLRPLGAIRPHAINFDVRRLSTDAILLLLAFLWVAGFLFRSGWGSAGKNGGKKNP